jgi:hypothetical protein
MNTSSNSPDSMIALLTRALSATPPDKQSLGTG